MTPRTARKGARKGGKKAGIWTDVEKAAMREHAQAMKAGKGDGEKDLLSKIAAMTPSDRAMASGLHKLVMSTAPGLSPKTWYGMHAWANKNGQVVCFYQSAHKFKTRYSTFGFSDKATLDDGDLWPTGFALKALTPAVESRIGALVKKAVGS